MSSIHRRVEAGPEFPFLVWRFPRPLLVASTASCGGGLGIRHWAINAQVASDYSRHDLAAHAAELAAHAGLVGDGVTMLTAADVTLVQRSSDGGVLAEATVGITRPTWAAAPDAPYPPLPGTINVVAFVPVRLDPAALLNALCTATEAKAQALFEKGIPGTGTASDAVTVVCPGEGDEEIFAGTRSVWGARLARAVHSAVLAGADPAQVLPSGRPF